MTPEEFRLVVELLWNQHDLDQDKIMNREEFREIYLKVHPNSNMVNGE
jgi:hypothetical protein